MGSVIQALMWWLLPAQPALAILVTLIIVIAISYGFELFSKITGKGYYEVMDAVAAVLGGVIGMAGFVAFEIA